MAERIMAEFNDNLWAPWRMEYIRSLGPELTDEGCFLCTYWRTPQEDRTHHVVWRGRTAYVAMNRFPYTNGHLLIALGAHKADFSELSDEELCEMSRLTRDALELLRATIQPQGFNIGYNLGRCAGAGLPGHLHAHVVPRWNGDTNYMAVVGGARVIPDSLDALWEQLVQRVETLGWSKGGPA